ncbi:MAG: DUF1003 domain-containing protein [Christensenellales bacterium]
MTHLPLHSFEFGAELSVRHTGADDEQNRQSEKDRLHAENDFQVNLKTEFIIEDLHHKLEESLKNQQALQAQIKALSEKLDAPTPMGENNETL